MIIFRTDENKGMTITEILISFAIGAMLLGIVLGMWYFVYERWAIDRIQTKLGVNLEIAMERIKDEFRRSSADYISLYKPGGETEYKAISFPAATPDANGFLTLSGGAIFWDKSVVYHVYNNPNPELRRTEFADNNAVLTVQADRETQLEDVFTDGDGSGTLNSANATTKVLFENAVDLTVTPTSQEFDGYSATHKRSDNVEFGSINLTPGSHDLRFEVTGQNSSSTGYGLGIDGISITPSGGFREAEVYNPQASSGDAYAKVYSVGWSGNHYSEYSSDAVSDFVTLRLYYDLWWESNFDDSVRDNTILTGNDIYAKLSTPKEGGEPACWQASAQTGTVGVDYPDAGETILLPGNVAVRNVLLSDNIDQDGGLIRVKFVAHSGLAFTIDEAYIAERIAEDDGGPVTQLTSDVAIGAITIDVLSTTGFLVSGSGYLASGGVYDKFDYTGVTGTSFTGVTGVGQAFAMGENVSSVGEKLFFSDSPILVGEIESEDQGKKIGDDGGAALPGVAIPANYYAWSNWAEFAIDETKDYLVTFHTPAANVVYWKPAVPTTAYSYYSGGNPAESNFWQSSTATFYIFAAEEAQNWTGTGNVASRIYDTKLDDPVYNQMGWSEFVPEGTDVVVKARSSDNADMTGATSWNLIAGSSVNPYGLAIGTGRYVQLQATLMKGSNFGDYANYPWIDNVAIDWPGAATLCEISGYFTQDSDYGIIKLTVDGQELIKGMEFNVTVSKGFQENTYQASLTAEIEPRNTGK